MVKELFIAPTCKVMYVVGCNVQQHCVVYPVSKGVNIHEETIVKRPLIYVEAAYLYRSHTFAMCNTLLWSSGFEHSNRV